MILWQDVIIKTDLSTLAISIISKINPGTLKLMTNYNYLGNDLVRIFSIELYNRENSSEKIIKTEDCGISLESDVWINRSEIQDKLSFKKNLNSFI